MALPGKPGSAPGRDRGNRCAHGGTPYAVDSIDLDWNFDFARLHSSTSYFSDDRTGQADYADKGHVFYCLLGNSGARINSGRSAYMTYSALTRQEERVLGAIHALVLRPAGK